MKAGKEQIARLDRLKKRSDFLRVQKEGQRWVSKGLVLQAARREGGAAGGKGERPQGKSLKQEDIPDGCHPVADAAGKMRFGLTASRKLSRKAVVRNRVRRRLRALACDILPVAAQDGVDYVLIGRVETETRPYDELCRDLRWCLRRMGFSREDGEKGGKNPQNQDSGEEKSDQLPVSGRKEGAGPGKYDDKGCKSSVLVSKTAENNGNSAVGSVIDVDGDRDGDEDEDGDAGGKARPPGDPVSGA